MSLDPYKEVMLSSDEAKLLMTLLYHVRLGQSHFQERAYDLIEELEYSFPELTEEELAESSSRLYFTADADGLTIEVEDL